MAAENMTQGRYLPPKPMTLGSSLSRYVQSGPLSGQVATTCLSLGHISETGPFSSLLNMSHLVVALAEEMDTYALETVWKFGFYGEK